MEVILDTRNQLTFLEKDVILMGFGKRVCELLAVIASLLLIGALVWYLSSGFGDRGYEKEGTLVWEPFWYMQLLIPKRIGFVKS